MPCPFCGRTDTLRFWPSSEAHEDCDGPHTDGSNSLSYGVVCDASDSRGCGASSGFDPSQELAAVRWNKRTPAETPVQPLVLNGHQLRQALEFLDNENETDLCFRLYTEDRHEPGKYGEPMPKGMYCWFFEYPEEGQLLLKDEPTAAKAADDLNLEPIGKCDRCGRKVWKADTLGLLDEMTQPNGSKCGGRFVAL